jgi:hypothetical protein
VRVGIGYNWLRIVSDCGFFVLAVLKLRVLLPRLIGKFV